MPRRSFISHHCRSILSLVKLSETSYPPCMRIIHEALESRSQLRSGRRVQYTVFLKSAGFKADDALEFYRDIFTRQSAPRILRRDYAYQFRHMYGLVGTGKDYGNRECVRIAEEACLGSTDCHGCFFSNHEIEDLGRDLERWQVPANRSPEPRSTEEAAPRTCGLSTDARSYRRSLDPTIFSGRADKL